MAVPQHVTRREFLDHLRRSGVLTAEQWAEAKRVVPESDRGRMVARALVQNGMLTRFQAERLLIGRSSGYVLDQYLILDELGRGGMGRVFKARHRTMNRIVALKVLAPGITDTDRARELFLREVRAAARLVHPNIVTAFDANLIADRYYLVLEFVDGPNLDQLVRRQGPLSFGLACDYIRQAANGLQCAFLANMVHRDIKPANILVQPRGPDGVTGLIKISDFGLARLLEPATALESSAGTIITKPNTVMGTPDYLSPEQAKSLHNTDIRSDLYSLGCTFYFLLTGRVPFPDGSSLEKLIRHSTAEPEPLEKHRADVPPAIAAIVRKLMAKNPDDRFQTPAELSTALEPFSVSGPTPWEPVRQADEPLLELAEPDDSDSILPAGGKALEVTPSPAFGLTPLPDPSRPILRGSRRQRRSRAVLWLVWLLLLAVLGVGAYVAIFRH